MSVIGNDWRADAATMIKAMATSPGLRDQVDLAVQVACLQRAGTDPADQRGAGEASNGDRLQMLP